MNHVVIAGAGPAGLTAALELLKRTDLKPIVFDSDTQVGGISKTINYRGNRMDLGGHRFFFEIRLGNELVARHPATRAERFRRPA
jgi:protoporphyrinogen oxidase